MPDTVLDLSDDPWFMNRIPRDVSVKVFEHRSGPSRFWDGGPPLLLCDTLRIQQCQASLLPLCEVKCDNTAAVIYQFVGQYIEILHSLPDS